ncbi:MAG: class I SAM-dependent RNA methyltransferase [Bdellovibrionaceae bacterium]|nr:class I SAM-dependent RNA methyltransferase [Bdellovibrio sp.]
MHSEHVVTVEKLAVGGDGVARIPFKDRSIVVFIKLAAQEDELKIKITFVEKNFLRADILEILKPSPARRQAPCPYFPTCGGCAWQHIDESEQVHQKEIILQELFQKFIPGVDFNLLPTIYSPKNLHYRNRIQLKRLGTKLGYFQRESHDIVDIDLCLIAEKEISDQIPMVKAKLRPTTEVQKFELKLNQKNEFEYYNIGDQGEGLSFSQVNNEINQKLVGLVSQIVTKINPTFVSELYAGAGNFTFDLLQKLPNLRMESVEMNSELTKFATQKLTSLSYQKRLFAFTSDCESFVARRSLSKQLVILDPPRAGCSDIVLKKIIETGPTDLIYISCHPVFLARDLQKIMMANQNFKIRHLQIFDMFPQTDHFETFLYLSTT